METPHLLPDPLSDCSTSKCCHPITGKAVRAPTPTSRLRHSTMSDHTPPEPDSPLVMVPPPLSVLPRSKPRARAYSKAQRRLQAAQAAKAESETSIPEERAPIASVSHSVQSTGPSTSTSQQPIITPPDVPAEAIAPAIAATGSTAPASSTTDAKPIGFSESLAEKLGAYAGQPTGIQQMAAAAKKGQTGLGIVNGGKGKEDEDHPLSDKCLKARYDAAPLFQWLTNLCPAGTTTPSWPNDTSFTSPLVSTLSVLSARVHTAWLSSLGWKIPTWRWPSSV